ncbi:phasin [Mesorhizobium sp.]|uniref:phasin n=1 Tax=Mesorhizobium sp. TaxID=1871066 RepID=UPI0025FE2D61|nr:phasin [Mesorhizobium sp.]
MAKIPGKTETIENVAPATFDQSEGMEQVRTVAEQGLEQAREAILEFQSNAEITAKTIESTVEAAKAIRNEVPLKAIAALHANAEAAFNHFEALIAAKSPSEFFELQAAFLDRQIENSVEQAKSLQAAMLKAAEDVSKPIQDAYERALKELKAA